ncbi:hypothetical protein G9A89_020942 [Geosiphon pyriformis]|nr:hypothetical protein G9A89_020942 [Geosiphon pyriformis]
MNGDYGTSNPSRPKIQRLPSHRKPRVANSAKLDLSQIKPQVSKSDTLPLNPGLLRAPAFRSKSLNQIQQKGRSRSDDGFHSDSDKDSIHSNKSVQSSQSHLNRTSSFTKLEPVARVRPSSLSNFSETPKQDSFNLDSLTDSRQYQTENKAAEARQERKIQDLEISINSLMNINAELDAVNKKQAAEIQDLKKRLQRNDTFMSGISSLNIENEDTNTSTPLSDMEFLEQERDNDTRFRQILLVIDEMIRDGKTAIEYTPKINGSRVLNSIQLEEPPIPKGIYPEIMDCPYNNIESVSQNGLDSDEELDIFKLSANQNGSIQIRDNLLSKKEKTKSSNGEMITLSNQSRSSEKEEANLESLDTNHLSKLKHESASEALCLNEERVRAVIDELLVFAKQSNANIIYEFPTTPSVSERKGLGLLLPIQEGPSSYTASGSIIMGEEEEEEEEEYATKSSPTIKLLYELKELLFGNVHRSINLRKYKRILPMVASSRIDLQVVSPDGKKEILDGNFQSAGISVRNHRLSPKGRIIRRQSSPNFRTLVQPTHTSSHSEGKINLADDGYKSKITNVKETPEIANPSWTQDKMNTFPRRSARVKASAEKQKLLSQSNSSEKISPKIRTSTFQITNADTDSNNENFDATSVHPVEVVQSDALPPTSSASTTPLHQSAVTIVDINKDFIRDSLIERYQQGDDVNMLVNCDSQTNIQVSATETLDFPPCFLMLCKELESPLSPSLPTLSQLNIGRLDDSEEMDMENEEANDYLNESLDHGNSSGSTFKQQYPNDIKPLTDHSLFFTEEAFSRYSVATPERLYKENVRALIERKQKKILGQDFIDTQLKSPSLPLSKFQGPAKEDVSNSLHVPSEKSHKIEKTNIEISMSNPQFLPHPTPQKTIESDDDGLIMDDDIEEAPQNQNLTKSLPEKNLTIPKIIQVQAKNSTGNVRTTILEAHPFIDKNISSTSRHQIEPTEFSPKPIHKTQITEQERDMIIETSNKPKVAQIFENSLSNSSLAAQSNPITPQISKETQNNSSSTGSTEDLLGPLLDMLDARKKELASLPANNSNESLNSNLSLPVPRDILTASASLKQSHGGLLNVESQSSNLIPYSSLTKEDHKEFLQMSLLVNQSPHLVDEQELLRYKNLSLRLQEETQKYIQWTYERGKGRFQYLNNQIKKTIIDRCSIKRMWARNQYPRYYEVIFTINISLAAPGPGEPILKYKELVHRIGTCYEFFIPEMTKPLHLNLDRNYWTKIIVPTLASSTDQDQKKNGSTSKSNQLLDEENNTSMAFLSPNSNIVESSTPFDDGHWQKTSMPVVSNDPLIPKIIADRNVDIVISSSGLCTLVGLHASSDVEFEMPVVVREHIDGDGSLHKTVYIDKPLVNHHLSPREYNQHFYDVAFKSVASNLPVNIEDIVKLASSKLKDSQGQLLSPTSQTPIATEAPNILEPLRPILFEARESLDINTKSNLHGRTPEKGLAENLKSSMQDKSPENFKETIEKDGEYGLSNLQMKSGNLIYTLWSFGDLSLLIRCKAHGFIYDRDGKHPKPRIVGMKTKLEYQRDIGVEEITNVERARWWIHTFIRGDAYLLLGRIDVLNNELFGVEQRPMTQIIPNKDWPKPHSKLVQNVLKRLHSSLPPGNYLLSHKKKDLHISVLKNVAAEKVQSNLTSMDLYDLHAAYSQVSEIDFDTVPFVQLKWEGPVEQVPHTFPPRPLFCYSFSDKGYCLKSSCPYPHIPRANLNNTNAEIKSKTKAKKSAKKKKRKLSAEEARNTTPFKRDVSKDFDSEIMLREWLYYLSDTASTLKGPWL